MSISTTKYKLSRLLRANIHSWLSTLLSLGQRVREITPTFALGTVPLEPNENIQELQLFVDVDDRHQQPHADLSLPSDCQVPPSPEEANTHVLPADPPDALAAAIEVKFLLPVLKFGAEDNGFPNDRRPIVEARQDETDDYGALIRRTHESVASTIWGHAATMVQQRSVTLHDIEAAGRLERDYWDTHWIVKKANSALPTAAEENRGNNYAWIPVEVCSPKQRWNDRYDLENNSFVSITAVLRALTARHRVTVNYTCDVHVHVGRADGTPLSLETLKRLATILWLSEDAIRSIRDPSSPNYLNVFTWGAEMTKYSRLAKLMNRRRVRQYQLAQPKYTPSDAFLSDALRDHSPAIRAIWHASSHLKLGRLLSGATAQYRRLGFNFSSLGQEDERARCGPKTIEFRVLEGTLDEYIISTWLAICWSLVEVSGEGACADGGADGRFVAAVKACVSDVKKDGFGQDTLRRADGLDDPDCTSILRRVEDAESRRARLRALAVDGLGVGADLYNAFIQRLLGARCM